MVDELLAEVRAARRSKAALDRHNKRIDQLLVEVRRQRPDLGLADIEEKIDRYYDRGTISRKTVPVLGADRTRKATRKRS